jgi:hypothetical protein
LIVCVFERLALIAEDRELFRADDRQLNFHMRQIFF